MRSLVPIQRSRAAQIRQAWLRCAVTACLLLLISAGAWAQAKPSEYDVKAAYLFNFGKFMRISGTQPKHPTFDICILGRDPIGQVLDAITANEKIDGHLVRVLRLRQPQQARQCEIVFISPYEGDSIRTDLAVLSGSETLTVSDTPDFLARGGMIQFVIEQDHVRFEVNLDAVAQAHVVLSSELLRVAAAVKGKPPGVPR